MSKQKQRETYSDLEDKRLLSLSPTVTEGGDQEMPDNTKISRSVVMGRQNRYGHPTQELEKAPCSIRQVQFTTLSKVVNRAFTGWIIKTQS